MIAARLTEGSGEEVLLVEAGPDYGSDPLPEDLANGRHNSMVDHDWGFGHRPTTAVPLRLPMPRGRVVGGSSAVNTCIALRGQPEDYDDWASRGLQGWGWADCLPAFKRLESDLDFPEAPHHGADGPLPVRRHPRGELVTWQAAFVDAARQLGFADCPDTNAPNSTGIGCHAMNKIEGRRVSAAAAYLTPEVRRRPQLTIQADTLVRRIEIAKGRVVAADLIRDGRSERILCRRVVLCAGAFGTPALLVRSGIGPRADLDRLGVPVVRDVPQIGAQLLDHPGNALFFRPRHPVAVTDPLIQTVLLAKIGDGPWHNDVQIQAGSVVPTKWGILRGTILMVSVCKPRSRGRLRFTSTDPAARPVIESRLLEHPEDRALASAGLDLLARMADTDALAPLGTMVYPPRWLARRPRPRRWWMPLATDSGYHPCGTVPMGTATDARGRIDGIEGLTVADASLFPEIPASNIHLPTLMLGERFGAWLRDDSP